MCIDNVIYKVYSYSMSKTWQNAVKSLMRVKGITQEDLGEHLGITKGAISHWLNGRRDPNISEIAKIFSFLGVKKFLVDESGNVSLDSEPNNNSSTPHQFPGIDYDILDMLNSLPTEKKEKFLDEMKIMKSHYDDYFNERLKKTNIKSP